jgi:hypothetical protein
MHPLQLAIFLHRATRFAIALTPLIGAAFTYIAVRTAFGWL